METPFRGARRGPAVQEAGEDEYGAGGGDAHEGLDLDLLNRSWPLPETSLTVPMVSPGG